VTFRKRVWPFFADDAESQTRMGAFSQTLALAGCTIGRNVRIEARWGTRDAERIHRDAVELAARPDGTRQVAYARRRGDWISSRRLLLALHVGTGSLILCSVSGAVRKQMEVATLPAAARMTHLRHKLG
jgi:hypothetical protein